MNKVCIRFCAVFLSLFIACSLFACSDQSGTFHYPLSKDTTLWIKNAVLSQPKRYWNEMNERTCFELRIDSQSIGYIFAIRKTKSKTIVYSCEEHDDKSLNKPDSIYGDVDSLPSELRLSNDKWILKSYALPDYAFWPYGSYCNDLVAYWGIREGGDFFGYIYDLSNRKIIIKKYLGKITIGTEHFGFLQSPEWQRSCNSVTFKKHEFQKRNATLNIPKEKI